MSKELIKALVEEDRATDLLIENLEARLEEATALLRESVEGYIVEKDPKLWTSRVREWLKNE